MKVTSRNNTYPGIFIAVEGIDGCGKTEATRILGNFIKQRFPHHELVTFRAPGGTTVGEKIRDILLNNVMDPASEVLLFLTSHNETIKQIIIPALQRGAIVLTDRFIDSTYAYQGYGRHLLSEVSAVHKEILKSFDPDHVIFIRADQSVANSRISSRGEANRFDDLQSDIKKNISRGMSDRLTTRLTDDPSRVTVIENNGTIDEFTNRCYGFVECMIIDDTYASRCKSYELAIQDSAKVLKEIRLSRDRLDNRLITPHPDVFTITNNAVSAAYDKWVQIQREREEFLNNNTPETFNKKLVQSKEQNVVAPVCAEEDIRVVSEENKDKDARTNFKDHEVAKIINEITNIATLYAGTQQLRQNVSQYITEAFKSSK